MTPTLAARACPICGRPTDPRTQPFCSVRCADVDLQSWLTGRYTIPAEPDDEIPEPDAAEIAGQRPRDFL